MSSLINSKAIGNMTLCPILLPLQFSKGTFHKYIRGAAFSRVLSYFTDDYLKEAFNKAPLVQKQVEFEETTLKTVAESLFKLYLALFKEVAMKKSRADELEALLLHKIGVSKPLNNELQVANVWL